VTALLSGSDAFDAAFATDHGDSCVAVADDGSVRRFPVDRWVAEADATDLELFVGPCAGPTIDIGCGPGRLTAALVARGLIALGIDVSTAAVLHARAGCGVGTPLADGNIGIGGRQLLAEVRPRGAGLRRGTCSTTACARFDRRT
jgi:SAM-dependent methyltransferase